MKKIILSIAGVLLMAITLSSQNAQLSGEILAPTGETVYLQYFDNQVRKMVVLDSAKLENGKFSLSTDLDSTTMLLFADGNEITQLLMEPGDNMQMTLHTSFFDETVHYSGKGSEKNKLLKSLALSKEAVDNHISNAAYGKEDVDTTALFPKIDEMYGSLVNMIGDYTKLYPDIAGFLEEKKQAVENTCNFHKKRIKRDIEFRKVVAALKGEKVFDFEGTDIEGNPVSIMSFKGKPVLIDFWATWCGPCKREMPSLQAIEEVYGEKVNIVSIAVWCEEDGWKEMAADYGFEHNVFIPRGEDKELKSQYMLNSIPRYILLDKDLNIVDLDAARPSSGELEGQLEALLK